MKILDIQQNTSEWEELRRSKIGASDIAIIMAGTKGEIYQLYLAKVAGKQKFQTDAMRRGHEMEAEARAWININNDLCCEPIVAVSDEHDWLMASFDGFDSEKDLSLEIKCPLNVLDSIDEHRNYSKWWWQVQAQYAVGGNRNAILLAYSPGRRVWSFISRDEDDIKQLLKSGKEFYQRVLNYDSPEDEVVEKVDEETVREVEAWKKAHEARIVAEELEELAKGRLIALGNGSSFKAGGVSVTKTFRRGAIEYKQIVQLKDVDLEKYRKGAVEFWRVG